MRRPFFFALGLFVFLLGAQALGVEKFVLKARAPAPPSTVPSLEPQPGPHRELIPRDWHPWSLMSAGAIACLYSYALYRQQSGK